jgi:hypothetical protein
MTRSQTIEVLNETISMQDRINRVVFIQETTLDYSTPGWKPGEPLYPDPREHLTQDSMYVRPVFELRDQVMTYCRGDDFGDLLHLLWCQKCDVGWDEYDECWLCGTLPDPKWNPSARYTGDYNPRACECYFCRLSRSGSDDFVEPVDEPIADPAGVRTFIMAQSISARNTDLGNSFARMLERARERGMRRAIDRIRPSRGE